MRVLALLLTTSVTNGPLAADEDDVKKASTKMQATAAAPNRIIVLLVRARLLHPLKTTSTCEVTNQIVARSRVGHLVTTSASFSAYTFTKLFEYILAFHLSK